MKKIIIGALLLIILGASGYYYLTHFYGKKNYQTENPDFVLTDNSLKKDFVSNETSATAKYTNKVVLVSGIVTQISEANVTLDGVNCTMSAKNATLKVGDKVKIQGRLVGYDSLIEETQMDQCSVIK